MKSRTNWKVRALEAEEVIKDASKAFDLIPIGPLSAGQVWVPSDVALYLLKKAKTAVKDYEEHHFE